MTAAVSARQLRAERALGGLLLALVILAELVERGFLEREVALHVVARAVLSSDIAQMKQK